MIGVKDKDRICSLPIKKSCKRLMVFVISSIPPPNILFPFISNQKKGVNLFLNLIINWCNKLNLIL